MVCKDTMYADSGFQTSFYERKDTISGTSRELFEFHLFILLCSSKQMFKTKITIVLVEH